MRYYGGKSSIAKEIVPIIQSYVDKSRAYWEPMCGGCNIVEHINKATRYASDISAPLISLLRHVQNGLVKDIPEYITKEEYDRVRVLYRSGEPIPLWYVGLVGYCASYGGRFFNGYTSVETSAGTIKNLLKQNFKGITFRTMDFRAIHGTVNFTFYCDPHYKSRNVANFPYDEFYKWAKETAKNNTVLISEEEMPEGFECIWEGTYRGKLERLFITRRVNIQRRDISLPKLNVFEKIPKISENFQIFS